MANVKISNLTAASTPVAGTEVLPIVQSGATVKVSIANLTPGLSTITTAKGGTGLTSFTANGVVYASSTSALTTGSVLTFDGAILGVNGVSVGRGAGAVSTNTAVGASALFSNSANGQNTVFGYNAGYYSTGSANSYIGYNAGPVTTSGASGSYNTALGASALASNNTASGNTAVGYQAGYTASTQSWNTFLGYQAGYSFNTGGTIGGYNCFVGVQAGYYVTTGLKNTIIGGYTGNQGGLDIRTASNKVVLSDGDGNPVAVYGATPNGAGSYALQNSWTFGLGGTTASSYEGVIALNGADTTGRGPGIYAYKNGTNYWGIGSYSLIVSGTATWLTMSNSGGGGVYLNGSTATSWTAVSDETRKVIIEPIIDAANKVATLRTVIGRLKSDDETVRRPYLIAQDVQAVLPEAVSENEDKEGPVLGLSYTEVIPLLVAAIKELKAEIDILKGQA